MTTQAVTPQQPASRPKRELEEVKEPKLFKFSTPGDLIAGILVSIGSIEITDKDSGELKKVTRYVLEDDRSGELFAIMATYDLAQKIRQQHRGRYVQVTFVGESKEIVKNGHGMREFKVEVERTRRGSTAAQVPEITDDDIPF